MGAPPKNKHKSRHIFTQETTQLIIIKTKMKMKNISHRYNINRTRSRHGHKYSLHKVSQCTYFEKHLQMTDSGGVL